jgi:hypothetical protein
LPSVVSAEKFGASSPKRSAISRIIFNGYSSNPAAPLG